MPQSKARKLLRADARLVYAEIVGWGKCLPPAILSNADLSSFLDTSDSWIFQRTGIRERPISHVPVSELAYVAAMQAMASANIPPEEVDLIVVGSCTGDEQMPNTASRVQRSIGARNAAAVDINTACTSFMYALSYGSSLVRTGAIRNAVVIGADTLSAFMDWGDRRPSVVFGDAAGAVVIKATANPVGIVAERLGCVYGSRDVLRIKGIGSAYANSGLTFGTTEWDFDGPEVFRQAVLSMSAGAREVLLKAGCSLSDIDLVIPHQANLRIIQAVARRLRTPMDKVFTHLEMRGNLSSASVPVAMVDALQQGRITPHCQLLIPAFGGGMTWSAHVIKWGERTASIGKSEAALSPSKATGLDIVRALQAQKGDAPREELPEARYSPSRNTSPAATTPIENVSGTLDANVISAVTKPLIKNEKNYKEIIPAGFDTH
jgi:3-oxoacyl-[acyl-carrier-protein] synthase III